MDAAIAAADAAVAEVVDDLAHGLTAHGRADDAMRPFVAAIAAQLRADDWDCVQEAAAFDRFRQEMLGYDDTEMIDWYRRRIEHEDDPDALREYNDALTALLDPR